MNKNELYRIIDNPNNDKCDKEKAAILLKRNGGILPNPAFFQLLLSSRLMEDSFEGLVSKELQSKNKSLNTILILEFKTTKIDKKICLLSFNDFKEITDYNIEYIDGSEDKYLTKEISKFFEKIRTILEKNKEINNCLNCLGLGKIFNKSAPFIRRVEQDYIIEFPPMVICPTCKGKSYIENT